jgi:hypothetical protein
MFSNGIILSFPDFQIIIGSRLSAAIEETLLSGNKRDIKY